MKGDVAIFVNGNDFYYLQKRIGFWIDPGRLLGYVKSFGRQIVKAAYYSVYNPDDESQFGYNRALGFMGYDVVPFPLDYNVGVDELRKIGVDLKDAEAVEEGRREVIAERRSEINAYLEMEMVVDMAFLRDRYETMCLVSGDNIYAAVLNRLLSQNKICKVIAATGTIDPTIRKMVGEDFVDLRTIRDKVGKQNGNFKTPILSNRPERALDIS